MPEAAGVLGVLFWLAQVTALLYILYRCLLGVLSLRPHKHPAAGKYDTRFLVLIPAHNEAAVIDNTVTWFREMQYPAEKLQVVVVADACIDQTESLARAAGAQVLVKPAPASTKGNTIQWALARPEIAAMEWDAMVIFDADSRPWVDFLGLM